MDLHSVFPFLPGRFVPKPGDRILKLKPSGIADVLFEFHQRTKRLYVVKVDPDTKIQKPGTRAEIVMTDVESDAHAWKYAAAFVRGMQHVTDPDLRRHQTLLVG